MYIIFGESAKQLSDKFTVLELDTIKLKGTTEQFTSYCVVENIPLGDFPVVDSYIKVHHDMMQAYRDRNWEYCETAIQGLTGKWNGELDSFYLNLYSRIQDLKDQTLEESWDGTVEKDIAGAA
jgi:hypothetical protein